MTGGIEMTTSTYIVTKVIAGVCIQDGTYYTREEVVDSIGRGNTWMTRAGGYEALIRPVRSCLASPYVETHRDGTQLDNLKNLEEC